MDEATLLLTKSLAEQEKCKILIERVWAELLLLNLGPDRIVEFVYNDKIIRLWVPFAQTDMIQAGILRGRTFFEHYILAKLREHIRPGSTILDIGANIGNHTVFFSKICGAAVIHAFEPQRVVQPIFHKNIELNGCGGVILHESALGDKRQSAEISAFRGNNLGATRFAPKQAGQYRMEVLDDLGLPKVDFMKIDVEGGQIPLLTGARTIIERDRPSIFIELLSAKDEFSESDALLRQWGYAGLMLHQDNYLYRPV